jgi:hypothetical protein
MRRVRALLTLKNGKLGSSIFHFDLPAVTTCPGRSTICERVCYAKSGRFVTRKVKNRLAWCYRQSLREDFAERMIAVIRRLGAIVVRLHVSGDLYSADYARKWLEVMRQCAKVRFYLYSRSWRAAGILPWLARMAALSNVRVWFSCDAEGQPETVPPGVRLAYLQHTPEVTPDGADLVFRVRGLRQARVGLPMACPQETDKQVNCGNCQYCWR